jgi:hypothetical protein
MTDTEFWSLVTHDDRHTAEAHLKAVLNGFSPEKVDAFDEVYRKHMRRAYTWELWGAAYVIASGCSDDGFTEFRNWLISRGKNVYEAALANPESLADLPMIPKEGYGRNPLIATYDLIANDVYEEKTGKELEFRSSNLKSPTGQRWKESPEELQRLYPRLWAKYGKVLE